MNAAIGYAFNNSTTKAVGKWSKVKAKVRSSAFQQVMRIKKEQPEALIWVLPVIFYVGTADDKLSDNVLTLYSQTNNRLGLNEEQQRRVEALIGNEELTQNFAESLPRIASENARKALYDVALTTAAINLSPQSQQHCLPQLAKYLNVEYVEAELNEKVRYLTGR